ncbi:gastrula zinc finger protein XlCGF57.1-like [Archocentrus centrarchus]|uniref:gastrula zinc finger protein XlCGF57.1-like n=1 Tax=Archocentrus centrarchus TaxID=63155 RepID=UPI0011EA1DC5|nr:gastrula zinc finger protein XlCGF57.1-like [Archocentrus centrarchus]
MWRLESLRELISQRLSAAVDDILGHVDRTIREFEEETELLEGKHVGAVFASDIQQLLLRKDEHQQRSFSPDQQDQQNQEPLHIKEEQEELQGLEEADVTKFLFSAVPVKNEDDEEDPQCSQLHHSQTEVVRDSVRGPVPEPSPDHLPVLQPCTDYRTSSDHEDSSLGCNDLKKSFSCSECGKIFAYKAQLESHMRAHTGERPFRCSVCKKCFSWRGRLQKHMKIHTGEKPFSCSVCGKGFIESGNLKVHMRIHTGERPFSCSICGKRYAQRGNLKQHMRIHRGETMLSCSTCDKHFTWLYEINNHKCVQSLQLHHNQTEDKINSVVGPEQARNSDTFLEPHTDKKTSHCSEHKGVPISSMGCNDCKKSFSCSECGKKFAYEGQLNAHMRSHTGERPFRCMLCRKTFSWKRCLQKHMRIHTGEKPYTCTVCGKTFNESGNLKVHMRIHTGEKPFSCSVCGKKYTQKGTLIKHLEVHREEK